MIDIRKSRKGFEYKSECGHVQLFQYKPTYNCQHQACIRRVPFVDKLVEGDAKKNRVVYFLHGNVSLY